MQEDSKAFQKLYEQEQSRVRRILYRITLCNQASLDELTQEVFLKAWRARAQLREPEKWSSWLSQIAYVTAIDAYRLVKKRQELQLDNFDAIVANQPYGDQQSNDNLIVKEALSKMDPLHRAAIVLFELEGWTMEECASVMKVPLGTVKSRLFHARQKLRDILEGGPRHAGSQ